MKYALLALKGMAMGFADVIPGVSGGTIALVAGIYSQFIEAIKSVNFRWIAPLFRWVFSGFSKDRFADMVTPLAAIHWAFLIPLGSGIVLAFGIGSVVVPHLMDTFPAETAAFFIGLILASTVVPYRQMRERGPRHVAWGIGAAILTFAVVGTKAEPPLEWVSVDHEASVSLEDFMRKHPSVRTAEQLYCATSGENDNVELRAAVAGDPDQAGAADRLDSLCSQLADSAGDLVASAQLRDREHLGRKDDLNPFNNVIVPAHTTVHVPRPHIWYIFMCGFIGICAMVLPGISGSFFLLVLGVYHFMLSSALKGFVYDLIHGVLPLTQGAYVAVFSLGCLLGILSFARLMSHLFHRHPSATLAVLVGMMFGSLRALWPWKVGEPHTGVTNVLPPFDASIVPALGAVVVGAAVVLLLTWAGAKLQARA